MLSLLVVIDLPQPTVFDQYDGCLPSAVDFSFTRCAHVMRLAVSGHTRILLTYILPVLLLSLLLNLPRILSLTPLGMEDREGSCCNYVKI